jgi:hypothetical protein
MKKLFVQHLNVSCANNELTKYFVYNTLVKRNFFLFQKAQDRFNQYIIKID